MMAELPEDKLATLTTEYRKMFGDYPPWHVNHGEDPEGALREAIETGTVIPGILSGNTEQDIQ